MDKMQFGVADYGLDVWFGGCPSLEERLEKVKASGFEGLEWLKGNDAAEAVEHAALFHRMGMDFASCVIGSQQFELTLKCAAAFGKEYVWLLIDNNRGIPMADFCRRANYTVEMAARYGIKIALHNHLGSRIESPAELDEFMRRVPGAQLLLDIGHYAAADGDSAAAVRKYHDRLASIHFKDVFIKDASLGLDRWGERLRFCALCEGNVGLDLAAVAKELKRWGYHRWLLCEQDTHLQDPYVDLKANADCLKRILA